MLSFKNSFWSYKNTHSSFYNKNFRNFFFVCSHTKYKNSYFSCDFTNFAQQTHNESRRNEHDTLKGNWDSMFFKNHYLG